MLRTGTPPATLPVAAPARQGELMVRQSRSWLSARRRGAPRRRRRMLPDMDYTAPPPRRWDPVKLVILSGRFCHLPHVDDLLDAWPGLHGAQHVAGDLLSSSVRQGALCRLGLPRHRVAAMRHAGPHRSIECPDRPGADRPRRSNERPRSMRPGCPGSPPTDWPSTQPKDRDDVGQS
jgi:hypothetical protein